MPSLVLRISVGGDDDFPEGFLFAAQRLDPKPWSEEQGIDLGYCTRIEVTEFEDGSLVAYVTRHETLSDEEFEARQREVGEGKSASRIRSHPGSKQLVRSYTQHYPVTSVKLLLDQFREQSVETVKS